MGDGRAALEGVGLAVRVLVTGHDGYIGTVLTPMLTTAGHDVVGLDSRLFDGCTLGELPPQVPAMDMDLRDVGPSELEGFEAVIHLAGISNDPLGDLEPDVTYEINHRASVRLAELAREAGVERFIFSSSCSLYGAAGEDFLDESASFAPVTPYGRSKVLAERDIAPLGSDAFCVTFLRNATVFGMSPRLRGDLVVNNLVGWACATGEVRLKSDGSAWRPLVHVEDVARAFLATLEAPSERIRGQAFNVGRTAENHRVRDVAKMVEEVVEGSRVSFADGAGADVRNYRVNCDRFARELPAFRPTLDGACRSGGAQRGLSRRRPRHRGRGGLAADADPARARAAGAGGPRRPPARAAQRGRARLVAPSCRSCREAGLLSFLDLGEMPLADALLEPGADTAAEERFPLEVALCPACSLVQVLEEVPPEKLFVDNYLYFSSFSDQLLDHAAIHARALIEERGLGPGSLVVEVASNDGYLLRNFAEQGIRVLGVDPAPGQAEAAERAGVPTLREFFDPEVARRIRSEHGPADVIVANNVMAHTPDPNGMVEGMALLLADDGVATVENAYVRDLIDNCEFDTIYHEHFSYYSCTSVDALVSRHGLALERVDHLDLHGGSLRWWLAPGEQPGAAARRVAARGGRARAHAARVLRRLRGPRAPDPGRAAGPAGLD